MTKVCNKCHGTGRIGFLNGDRRLVIPCKCKRRELAEAAAEGKVERPKPYDALMPRLSVNHLLQAKGEV